MSLDIRFWNHIQYETWFRNEVDRQFKRYMNHEITRNEWVEWHHELADVSTRYILARIRLYGRGYLSQPPF